MTARRLAYRPRRRLPLLRRRYRYLTHPRARRRARQDLAELAEFACYVVPITAFLLLAWVISRGGH